MAPKKTLKKNKTSKSRCPNGSKRVNKNCRTKKSKTTKSKR